MGALPQSRFLLAHLGLLVSEHQGHSLSLLLNSGVLALTQTILRLVGKNLVIDFTVLQFNIFGLSFCAINDLASSYQDGTEFSIQFNVVLDLILTVV